MNAILWLQWLLQCGFSVQCKVSPLVVKWLDRFNSLEGFTAHRWVSTKLGFPKNSSLCIYTSCISFASSSTCLILREVINKYADLSMMLTPFGGWWGESTLTHKYTFF